MRCLDLITRIRSRDGLANPHSMHIAQLLIVMTLLLAVGTAAAEPPVTATFARVSISGNNAITSSLLDAIAVEYAGRAITDEDLQTLLKRLDDVYAAAGFRTSRATVPNQDLDSGTLRIEIIENGIERIDIVGAQRVSCAYLRKRLSAGLGTPLNVDRLNDNLRLLMLEQVVKNLRAEFKPGSTPGRSILSVTVEEGAQFNTGVRLANDRSPTAGEVRAEVGFGVRDVLGLGDQVDLVLGKSAGLRDFDLRFRAPVNSVGTELAGRYSRFSSQLVEEQFEVLDAKTRSRGAELGVTQTLWRTAGRQVGASLRFTSRQSESFLRGEPHTFSPGANNGRLDVKAARLGLSWLERTRSDVISLRYTWSIGLRGLGGTEHREPRPDLPDSSFHTSLLQAQWLHTIGPRAGSFFLRVDWQHAGEPLLSLEKFAVGGYGSVRGYRRSRVVKDNGWSASAEYRLPVIKLAVPGISLREGDGQLSLVAFIDAGRAWNEHDAAGLARTLLAAGPGLRWDASRDVRAELYWGAARRHLPDDPSNDIQDRGIHFALSARYGF